MKHARGILGAIIGGLIGTIPWIVVYVYMEFMFSPVAAVIAITANFGYHFFKGKVDKNLPIIIGVASILSIIFTTLVIIPVILIAKEGFEVSLHNLNILYDNKEFMGAITKDLIYSILFTLLGIAGIVKKIKDEIDGVERKVVVTKKNNNENNTKEDSFCSN